MSAPSLPGASSRPSETGSATTTSSAPAACASSATAGRSSSAPKKFGCWTTTAAVSAPIAAARASGSVAAPACRPTVCGRGPYPADSVASTCRYSGCTPAERTTSPRCVCTPARNEASASAVPPSYMEALLTSMPVSSQIAVWNSKMVCSTPWLRSGW